MATSTPVTTQQLILPKPKAPQPVPLIFVPVNITLTNGLCNNERGQISLIARTIPSAPPPLPPPSLLKQCRRRIPILIDQKSIKKNLQLNKQTLQTKLLHRPESSQLIERGILRSEEEKLRRFQHRENIRSHIEKRPTRETLVTQGILLSNACVDPLIQVRGQLLKRNKLVDNLNSKLRKRPGPLELVNRKILQVDAELEQAVQEGRLPFTPTLSSPSSSTFGETTITTEMISTIIPPLQIRHDEQQYSSSSSSSASATATSVSLSSTVGPKAKIRKKSQQLHRTPYDNTSINTNKIIKLKSIASGKRSANESIGSLETSSTTSNLSTDFSNSNGISPMETDDIHSDSMQSETNYEINLKQQQIYLQWQEDHHHETNVITPAMSSTTSNCSTPLQSNDTPSIHSTRSSFSVSSAHSGNHGNTRFSSLYSPSVSPTQITETTTLQIPIIESEKPKSKLADFKVQDLKNECKKRQLPVSGAKPQLLERLKPYEDVILATLAPSNGTTISSKSSNITIPSAVECNETSPSAGTCQNSCGHQQQHQQQQSIYCQTKPLLPAQDVITDYLQQCQPQKSQQKPLVLQLPPNSKPPQLVQVLVDSNGTVVGVAAMPQQTITPTKSSVPCCCVQCKKQPGSHISTIAETVVQTKSHESKPNEPTFSFSQMGSGGQFTLANSSPVVSECRQMAQNCAGCIAAASQSAIKIVSTELASTNSSRSSVATVQASSNSSHNLCTAPPLIRSNTSSTMSSTLKKPPHIALQKSESNSSTVEQTVAAVAHRRHSIPATVFSHNEDLSDKILSPDQICQIPSPNVQILSTHDDENDTNLDEIDPNVLMTAKTFSQHEENLRIQQRLIEDLQAELAKSQEQLRREQKLIIAAKRLQLRTDQQTGKQCTQAEILLNNLDIKQINKHHIQHFIQHKSQQQSVQSQSNDYQQLLQVEQKLQEELHMEQAVQDIVRLIKQDGRTALLIVQLLRRYQLERNHQLQQADAATQQQKQSNDKISIQRTTAASTISGQNELTPGSIQQQQQECSGRTSVMSSKSITNENIVDTCCQQLSHQPQNVESCCKNRTCLNQQQKSAQIVVIDDSPASSPAPVINVPTVGETLQKQKETTQRSKSQNPRTNKRKNNGSRSIWAKTNLIEKSASFTNANSTSVTPSKIVDMEEIFRTVINDTSDSRETPLLATSTIDTSYQQSQKSQPLHQQQKITNMDASSELVPQLNGFHLVANSDDSSNSAIADDHMDHTSSYQHVLNPSNGYSQEYVVSQQPMQTEICSTTAIFIQPENISSCHVDCYSKPRNENSPDRVEIIGNGHEYIQTTNIQQFEYAKNEDFDDLMDVLRDDQECINGHMTEDGNCGREILGYTSAELATFLAADENVVNNGNIYETFVPTQGQEHYQTQNYQQHCIQQQQQTITYENQGNIEYEITAGNLGQHSTLHIEPHQEQAIDDILNNSDMMEPSVEWFDNYFQSPITERQMTACGSRPPNGTNIHRPMDTFV